MGAEYPHGREVSIPEARLNKIQTVTYCDSLDLLAIEQI